jgi:phosphoglycerate dehydrogenase-like enzyme
VETLLYALGKNKPNVAVGRNTWISEADINADTTLQLVVREGVGYDSIDVARWAKERVFVASCTGNNAHAVTKMKSSRTLCPIGFGNLSQPCKETA